MSEKVKLEPREVARFLACIGASYAYQAEQTRRKTKDLAPVFALAIALGFSLARRQPELFDGFVQWCNLTQLGPPDEYLDSTLTLYRGLVDTQK